MDVNPALFAASAYGDAAADAALAAAGWRRRPAMRKAVLWARGRSLVAALRGTMLGNAEDDGDDGALLAGTELARARFAEAIAWARALARRYRSKALTLVGHSLGGSLALHAADKALWGRSLPVVTYAGYAGPPLLGVAAFPHAVVWAVVGDPIGTTSLALRGVAERHALPPTPGRNPHSLDNFL